MVAHLRRVSMKEVSEILKKHLLWLQEKPGGVRADLSRCDLRLMNFSLTVLVAADLSHSDLSRTNFFCANMQFADLTGAKLSDANFQGVDLSFGELDDVSISHSDFTLAKINYANLRKVEGREVCLNRADLSHSSLKEVNLQGASLIDCSFVDTRQTYVDFRNAVQDGADHTGAFCIGCKY